jgi:hypothetical protein
MIHEVLEHGGPMTIKPHTGTIHDDEGDVVVLTTLSSLLEKIGLGATPKDFGLPDLLATGLTPAAQDALLNQMVGECPANGICCHDLI